MTILSSLSWELVPKMLQSSQYLPNSNTTLTLCVIISPEFQFHTGISLALLDSLLLDHLMSTSQEKVLKILKEVLLEDQFSKESLNLEMKSKLDQVLLERMLQQVRLSAHQSFLKLSLFKLVIHFDLFLEQNDLLYAVPGGLIGVGLKVDPSLTRSDRLIGHILGHPGSLPEVLKEIDISFYLLRRLLGVKSEGGTKKSEKVAKIKKHEILMVNVGSTSTGGKVLSTSAKSVSFNILNS
jgi:hypothetical protein